MNVHRPWNTFATMFVPLILLTAGFVILDRSIGYSASVPLPGGFIRAYISNHP
jgi:hypothetical protein